MSQSTDGYVAVPAVASPTVAIRNLNIQILDSDGVVRTVAMQVVVPVDKDGYSLDAKLAEHSNLLRAILRELRAQNTFLSVALGQHYLQPTADDDG